MHLQTIQAFVAHPPPTHLNTELAVGFVLSVLLQQDTSVTELRQRLEQEYPAYCLSDTILSKALTFLETKGVVRSSGQKVAGRGRPRRMLTLAPQHQAQAAALVQLWQTYMAQHPSPGGLSYNHVK